MKPLKLRDQSWYQLLFFGMATTITLAVTPLAHSQAHYQNSVPAQSLGKLVAERKSMSASLTQNDNQSIDWIAITWHATAALGLLSGMASLGFYQHLIIRTKITERVAKLEKKASAIEKKQQSLSELRLTHEQDIKQEVSSISAKLSASEHLSKKLSGEVANIAAIEARLTNLERQITAQKSRHFSTPLIQEENSLPQASPINGLTEEYQAAVIRRGKGRIWQMAHAELNITEKSESDLLLGPFAGQTELQVVKGGGSYLLISDSSGKHFLYPSFQTLESFTTKQPQKGIFDYEQESVSKAELRQPAKVQEIGDGVWKVIAKGIVVVPA